MPYWQFARLSAHRWGLREAQAVVGRIGQARLQALQPHARLHWRLPVREQGVLRHTGRTRHAALMKLAVAHSQVHEIR